jgi:nucleoside-diphosphate-sugar epimerase
MAAAPAVSGRVALTGASGFIGGHLVTALDAAGFRLRLLARREPPLLRCAQVPELVIGDLEDATSLEALVDGCSLVIHAAGLVKARSRADFFRANAEGTARLVGVAARAAPQPRFLLVSSIAAREPGLSSYCASKRAGEDALKQHAGTMPWTILRPCAVYGPGDQEFLPFFRAIRRGVALRPARVDPRISMIFVKDFVDLVAVLAKHEVGIGECWEIDDGTRGGHDWGELAAAAAAALGSRPLTVRVPRLLLELVGAYNEAAMASGARPRVLSREKVRELFHAGWVVDAPAPPARTNWQPRWDLKQGFAETVVWYRANRWL